MFGVGRPMFGVPPVPVSASRELPVRSASLPRPPHARVPGRARPSGARRRDPVPVGGVERPRGRRRAERLRAQLPGRGGGEAGKVLRPVLAGLGPCEVDRGRLVPAGDPSGRRAGGGARPADCHAGEGAGRRRLPQHLLPARRAAEPLGQPPRLPRALRGGSHDRGGRRALPRDRQAHAADRREPAGGPDRADLRARARPDPRVLRPRGDRARAGEARPRDGRGALRAARRLLHRPARPGAELPDGGDAAPRGGQAAVAHVL